VPSWLRPNAPRFHTLLERREGRRIFLMTRATWQSFRLTEGQPVLLTTEDLAETPLAIPRTFMFGTAGRRDERVELSIYRADLGDIPDLINVDTYEVWEGLPGRFDVRSIVNAATTSTGPNLDRYLDGHVFLAQERPGDRHHQPTLPDEVVALLKRL
jgi:hypothetical protein